MLPGYRSHNIDLQDKLQKKWLLVVPISFLHVYDVSVRINSL
jgi:hypothetical protein